MLPSMPFLDVCNSNTNEEIISVETLNNTSANVFDTLKESNSDNKVIEADSTVVDADDEEVTEKDNEEEITALMVASTTIKNNVRKGPTRAEKKKERLRKEYVATLSMLSPEDPVTAQEKDQSYARAYFDKAREQLDSHDYEKLLEILNSFNEKTSNASQLYKRLEAILKDKHQDLLDEFLTFLTPAQAKDIYFKEQPAQLRKICRSVTDLSMSTNVTMDNVKNTILPLLKGNTLLADWFLQIFPTEPPPQSLLRGPWEQIDIKGEANMNDNGFESITVPEIEDPYGGPNCICTCHQEEDSMYKPHSHHCIPCGIKFLQGRVYIQTGKGLRLANITFNGNSNVDHNTRLNCSSLDRRKRRCEVSPSKQISPAKDHQDEVRAGNDSEDETDSNKRKGRATRSPRKKKVKLNGKVVVNDKVENDNQITIKSAASVHFNISEPLNENNIGNNIENSKDIDKKIEESCDIESNKLVTDEPAEWDCNTSVESVGIRHSPEHSAESESEFCEESSQDNINTETDDSAEELEVLSNSPVYSENSNSNAFEEISWTRDEDKVILETLQKEGDSEDTYIHIADILGNRTLFQIKERINTLMNLLRKMTSFTK